MGLQCIEDFPGGSDSKASAYNAGDPVSIPGWGRSPEEGNGNSLQYSCLESATDRGAWRATVHRVPRVRYNLVTKPPPFSIKSLIPLQKSNYTGDSF